MNCDDVLAEFVIFELGFEVLRRSREVSWTKLSRPLTKRCNSAAILLPASLSGTQMFVYLFGVVFWSKIVKSLTHLCLDCYF